MRGEEAVVQEQSSRRAEGCGPRASPRIRWARRASATRHRATLSWVRRGRVHRRGGGGAWGAAEIATERLEAGAIVGRDPDVGVEIEAVELGLMRTARADVTEVRLVATRPWTEAPTRPARIGEPSGIELKAICALASYSSAT